MTHPTTLLQTAPTVPAKADAYLAGVALALGTLALTANTILSIYLILEFL